MKLGSVMPLHIAQNIKTKLKIEDENKNNREQRRALKIGDIVCLKFNTEFDKMGEFKENEGYFSGYLGGDGLALNSINCYHQEITNYKTQSRFLFMIDVPESETFPGKNQTQKQNSLANKLDFNMKNKNILIDSESVGNNPSNTKLEAKSEKTQEKDEVEIETPNKRIVKKKNFYQKKQLQKGDPLTYGLKICLKHVYSKGYVAMNKFKLSNEKNSVQVGIRNIKSKDCTIKIFDPSNTKKPGENVTSDDTISLQFSSMNYNLKINENSSSSRTLEVNAGKVLCMFRIQAYTKSSDFLKLSNNILKNGDIIKLYNKETDMYLSANYKTRKFKKKKRKVQFIDGDCEEYMDQEEFLDVNVLTNKTVKGTGKKITEAYPDNSEENILSYLWEVRYPQTLKCMTIGNSNNDGDAFYLKHVMTGDFLFCQDGDKLVLKFLDLKKNEDLDPFLFFFKMKNSWTSDNSIK
jgi:hypothetical protein